MPKFEAAIFNVIQVHSREAARQWSQTPTGWRKRATLSWKDLKLLPRDASAERGDATV